MRETNINLRLAAALIAVGLSSAGTRVLADDDIRGPASVQVDAAVERVMRDSFISATPEQWKERIEQDEVQKLCSHYRNQPPPEVARRVVELSNKVFRYPADGRLL
ncbi:MAG: hypothetical protein GTO41_13480, partial [Burkholderiales bacterium]|nr:hypothetical protein [Burkholderiales bacterium]